MSAIDYSVWDKIELSDDEDIECHPNVDKMSLVRWRKEKIHQDRAKRREGIEQCRIQLEWLSKYTEILKKEGFNENSSSKIDIVISDEINEHMKKLAEIPENLLLTSVSSNKDTFKNLFQRISQQQELLKEGYDKLLKEENSKLSVDQLCHDGFDSKTLIRSNNKPSISNNINDDSNLKKTENFVGTLLNPEGVKKASSLLSQKKIVQTRSKEEKYITNDDALFFSRMNNATFPEMYEYLRDHKHLVSQDVADEILAAAFEYQTSGKISKTTQLVRKAIVLQFCKDLGGSGAQIFFTRMHEKASKATEMYESECSRTLEHICRRCDVLKKKASGKLFTGINLNLNEEKTLIFRHLPIPIQQALVSEDLNKVKEEISKLSQNEQENMNKSLLSCGLIVTKEDCEKNESLKSEEQCRLLDEMPFEFSEALQEGDTDKINSLLLSYTKEESERVLELCKKGDFIEVEEIDSELPDSV